MAKETYPLPPKMKVVMAKENMPNGKTVDILVLQENNVEKYCHLTVPIFKEVPVDAKNPEGEKKTIVFRQACNSRCAQFKFSEEPVSPGSDQKMPCVILTCGAGVRHCLNANPIEGEGIGLKKV